MRYIFLYFYRWLKVTLLNLYRGCFWLKDKEIQRYVPGDLVAVDSDDGKFFVEVLDVKYCGVIRLKPYYKFKSVMREFDSSKYFQLVPPNRRATPLEMRKYESFLSQLEFESGDWFYDAFKRNDIYRVLKIELDESSGDPRYIISSFSGKEFSTSTLSQYCTKLLSQPKFRHNSTVHVESTRKQGVIVGAVFSMLREIRYDVLVDNRIKHYTEDELLEFQKSCKMENTKVESQEARPLFKVGDKVRIVTPKDKSNYRFGYVDEMQKLEGQTAVITRCTKYAGDFSFPDDGYVYRINIGNVGFDWSSQSFEKVEQDGDGPQPLFQVGDKVKLVPSKNKPRCRVGCTDTMQKMEGTFAIITQREQCKYPNDYDDDGYIYHVDTNNKFVWSSQLLEKVESGVIEDPKPQPLFKIGDTVKILPPKSLIVYRHGYNDSMKALEGKTATITNSKLDDLCGSYNDDGYIYTIDLDGCCYSWSSQSFMKVESAPLFKVGDKVKIVPPKDSQKYRYGYCDVMKKLEYQVAVIIGRNKYDGCFSYPDDGYEYQIDIDSSKLKWSSQSFMKLEEFQQQYILQSAQCDVTSVQVDGSLLTTYPIQCGKLSIFDCLSDDKRAKKEKEEKKEKYKLNFKIK